MPEDRLGVRGDAFAAGAGCSEDQQRHPVVETGSLEMVRQYQPDEGHRVLDARALWQHALCWNPALQSDTGVLAGSRLSVLWQSDSLKHCEPFRPHSNNLPLLIAVVPKMNIER